MPTPSSHPFALRARLVHHLAALGGAAIRHRLSPAVGQRLRAPRSSQVPVPAGQLHTLSWGDPRAPTVVLLHGLNANARYWTGVASLLQHEGWRAVAPDLRGHGGTGPLPGSYHLEQLRADLTAWLDALQLDHVPLVGHSWGGKVAADLAAAHPARISALSLVDPVPPEGLDGLLQQLDPLRQAVFAPERGPFADQAELDRAKQLICWLRHAEPWMLDAFDASFRRQPDGPLRPVASAEVFDAIYDELRRPSPLPLSRLTMPVQLVLATFSVVRPAQRRRLARELPQLALSRVAGEHSLHAVNSVGLHRAMQPFLRGSQRA